MAETQAASSPAEVQDPFNGGKPTMAEFSHYRNTNEVPDRFKPAEPAESAPADLSEKTTPEGDEPESSGESEAPTDQNQEPSADRKPRRNATQRIAQLDATIAQLWEHDDPDLDKISRLELTKDKIARGAGLARKTEPATVNPAQQQQQAQPGQQSGSPADQFASYDAWEKPFIEDGQGDKWLEQWHKDHPGKSFESGQLAVKAFMRSIERQFEQREQALRTFATTIREAEDRYEDGKQVVNEALRALHNAKSKMHPDVVFELNNSTVLPDLGYMISASIGMEEFISLASNDPRAARAKIFELEKAINEVLADPDGENEPAPARVPEKKVTKAPKPPSPVNGGGSSRTFDENDTSLSANAWMRERTRQVNKKGKLW